MGEPTYLFHPTHGKHLFDSDALPDMDLGWYDSPKRFPAQVPLSISSVPKDVAIRPRQKSEDELEREAQRSEDPQYGDPHTFGSVDEYMEEFVSRLDSNLSNHEKGLRKKAALEHYGMVKYQATLEGRTLGAMADELEALESGKK